MLDEGVPAPSARATRALFDDGRLTWTVTEAAKLLGISRPAPTRRPAEVSYRSG